MGNAKKKFIIRKAKAKDTEEIFKLVKSHAFKKNGTGQLLPLKKQDILEVIKSGLFFVAEEKNRIIACCSVIQYNSVAELRSLAVNNRHRGEGIGKALTERCIKEARKLGHKKLYALTQIPEFFIKMGFRKTGVPPEKMIKYCANCPIKNNCVEVPFVREL